MRVKHGYKNAICTSMGEALIHFLMLILVLPNSRGSRSIAPAHMVRQCILNLVCTGHRSRCKLKVRRGIERFPVFDRPQLVPPQLMIHVPQSKGLCRSGIRRFEDIILTSRCGKCKVMVCMLSVSANLNHLSGKVLYVEVVERLQSDVPCHRLPLFPVL